MEPPNATAGCAGGRCEIWAGTQFPDVAVRAAARALGISTESVVLHPQRMGGSFGRKEHTEFVVEAALLARAADGRPVQLVWTRDDDLRHDRFHPASGHRLEAALDERGRIVRWFHRIATPSPERQWGAPPARVPYAECTGAWSLPYAAAALRVEFVELRPPVALGFWHGVGIVANAFAVEGFVDELAHAARRDPLEFRMAQLGEAVESLDRPPYPLRRLRAALELAAARAGWGAPLPPGRGRGVAGLVFNAQSACATVAEVAVSDGVYRVERLVCAIDCGLVVNPTGLEATVESALAWGLSALDSEITFADGAPRETSLLSYPILPRPRMPRVEVHAVPGAEPPSGAGEIPVPTVAPAVANAIFAACGRRVRRLPLGAEDLG